jgi:DNA-binding CsgD family transcriptional regulator/PAS domain-containing protein
MSHLRERELRSVLEFLRSLYAAPSLEGFQQTLLTSVRGLVPADVTAYVEASPRDLVVNADPATVLDFPDSRQLLRARLHESPLLGSYMRGNGAAVKISDFLTRRQWERRRLYQDCLHRLQSSYMLAKGLPGPRGRITAVTLHRGRRDFSEAERDLLTLLGPHLNQAFANATTLTRLADELTALRRGVETLNEGMVAVDREGQVTLMTSRARRLLGEYLGTAGRGRRLPELVARWLRAQQLALASVNGIAAPIRPLIIDRGDARLVARLVGDPQQTLVIVEEQKRRALRPAALTALGLTPREAEVLAWIAQGKTNAEIGVLLGTSPRTIDKHVERVLTKLRVESRTAAAARALTLTPADG